MTDFKDGITVTKLDAARRQLRTALRLWFHDGDPVSIHALLAAAHEIIHRLYRNKGLRNLMFDNENIEEEHRGYLPKRSRRHQASSSTLTMIQRGQLLFIQKLTACSQCS
jgi:hypothetical protein